MNLQVVLDWFTGEMSPMAKWWTTKRGSRRGVPDRSPSYAIDRGVGERDAIARHMNALETRQRGRAALIGLWLTQVALALMFLMAGGSKLAGVPAMVSLFGALGLGQWFRYVTGVIEVTAAAALLVPSAAIYGAMLLIPTMLGAAAANLHLGQSPAAPLVLLLLAAAVAWARRHQLRVS